MLATTQPIPLPALSHITTRVATMDDLAFVDKLQKLHSRQLGFFPRAQIEGYVKNGWMRIAEEVASSEYGVAREDEGEVRSSEYGVVREDDSALRTPYSALRTAVVLRTPVGYVAYRDRYQKRDELGAVFQLCVDPTRQRGLIGATLLKSAVDAAAYGCKLFCCWCAQDLPANRFWESMGFVPIAFRAGSEKKSRVHIFWQRRIRAGDESTPYWYPSGTDGGALRAGRIVLPIPQGTHWSDDLPRIVGGGQWAAGGEEKAKALPAPRPRKTKTPAPVVVPPNKSQSIGMGGMRWAGTPAPATVEQAIVPAATPKPKREPVRIDPRLAAMARELRDRWMEQVNVPAALAAPKYDVARQLASNADVVEGEVVEGVVVDPSRLIAA